MNCDKNLLIKICIVILILIIIRFLYKRLTENTQPLLNTKALLTNIEGFEINDGNSIDLLSKLKSSDVISLTTVNLNNNIIRPWTTRLYNMQSVTKLSKAIALYQPKLFIKNIQYSKLGDVLCQNTDYSPPTSEQITLLINKNNSDIKPPVNYDLIVNYGDENINSKDYDLENYISDITQINIIKKNITNCSTIFFNINNIIQNNLNVLQVSLSTKILNENTCNIAVDTKQIAVIGLTNNNIYNFNIISDPQNLSKISLPAGTSGQFITNNNPISFTLPSVLDKLQTTNTQQIISLIPNGVFQNILPSNIEIKSFTYNIFELLPIIDIVNILEKFCNDVQIIYDSQSNNNLLLTFLNLADNKDIITTTLANITVLKNFVSTYDNINNVTITSNPELSEYLDPILNTVNTNTTIFGLVLNIIKNMKIKYLLSYLNFTTNNISLTPTIGNVISERFNNDNSFDENSFDENSFGDDSFGDKTFGNKTFDIEPFYNNSSIGIEPFIVEKFGFADAMGSVKSFLTEDIPNTFDPKTKRDPTVISQLTINSFNNTFLNIPKNSYNINYNTNFNSKIKTIVVNINTFTGFLNKLNNNDIKNLPLKIYRPIPPPGYIVLGDIFCNTQSQLAIIKQNDSAGNGVCCIPENCIREIRPWSVSDKVFEFNQNNVYWSLYYNTFTGTFVSTNKNTLPEGKVCKVVACVKKCTAVDDLEKADECARKYYNINKQITVGKTEAPNLASDQEEVFYLDKLQAQSDSITKLATKAQQMQLDIDKANIVNREMNKHKLQTYIDTQKRNIDIVSQRLIDDKNKIQTNINIPIETLNNIIKGIKNLSKLSQEEKTKIISALLNNKAMADSNIITNTEYENNLNQVLSSCPQYDLTGLVKKDLVSNVCYGCDNPQ